MSPHLFCQIIQRVAPVTRFYFYLLQEIKQKLKTYLKTEKRIKRPRASKVSGVRSIHYITYKRIAPAGTGATQGNVMCYQAK